MIKNIIVMLLCCVIAVSAAYADTTNRLIIKYKNTNVSSNKSLSVTSIDTLNALVSEHVSLLRAMSGDAYVLQLPREMSIAEARQMATQLAAAQGVEYVEVDRRVYPKYVPLDALYANQWNLDDSASAFAGAGDIRAQSAWDITRGLASVVVAILDTGFVSHRDISAARVLQGFDFISNVTTAGDGDGRDNDATDPGDFVAINDCGAGQPSANSSWHGLLVTSVIAATANNNQDIAGVDHNALILPLRVLGKCGGFTSDIIDAIRWAAGIAVTGIANNANPAKVINLSLGSTDPCSTSEQSAINDAVAAGSVVVVSAGNESADINTSSPANCNNVVAVAATTRAGSLASYSNSGLLVDVSAPGGIGSGTNRIPVLFNDGTTIVGNDVTATAIGTSVAAAEVSGVLSLMFSINSSLTPSQAECVLKETARTFPVGTCSTANCGSGIVNANAAIQGAQTLLPACGGITNSPAPAVNNTTAAGGGGGGGGSMFVFSFLGLLWLVRFRYSARISLRTTLLARK